MAADLKLNFVAKISNSLRTKKNKKVLRGYIKNVAPANIRKLGVIDKGLDKRQWQRIKTDILFIT